MYHDGKCCSNSQHGINQKAASNQYTIYKIMNAVAKQIHFCESSGFTCIGGGHLNTVVMPPVQELLNRIEAKNACQCPQKY